MESQKPHTVHPLEVKKGIVMRTLKDYELYKKEVSEAKLKLDSLAIGGDEHEVRRAKDFVDESSLVLEFTRKKLAGYAADLDTYIRESILPLMKAGNIPPMCKAWVKDAKKSLDELDKNHPEVGFKFPTKAN